MDLYNIPGDTGKDWRLNKFVEYQHEVPSIHYRVLGNYIVNNFGNEIDPDDAVMMCWYMSCTYNEVTCILLQRLFAWRDLTPKTVTGYCNKFWETYKSALDFGSSRKYAKNMDWFPTLMEQFLRVTKKHPYRWLLSFREDNPEKAYKSLYEALLKIPYTGRFATDLFMECILYLNSIFKVPFYEPSELDWKRCSNLTSGLLNIFYKDEEANLYDKTKKLPVEEELLTKYLNRVQKRIQKTYPDQPSDINLFVGKICSFRNLFKAARYGGFHHDRELGVLRRYEKALPEYQYLWDRVFDLRKTMFPERFLGELHDWDGIRPERKKLWLREGLTGAEPDIG